MWEISKQKNLPVYQQIMTLISSLVDDGTLLPGEKLPSERQLASVLGVNRSTVIHALDELVSIGVIIRKRGSGTFINDGKWGIKTEPAVNWGAYLSHSAFDRVDPYMQKVSAILSLQSEDYIDAYSGELSYNLIPNLDVPAITWQTFIREEQKEDALGYLPLRQKICEEVASSSNTLISPEQLLLTNGAQQALFLILQVLLQPGDAVAIENPSFLYSLPIFQAAGIRLYGIPVDRDGMKVELLEKEILHHRIKMVITNPTFQNPTGTVMSDKRRKLLVDVCQRYRIPIVEDDVFGQLNFGQAQKINTLKSLDPTNVIYIGSLSKILGSTTKIGWVSAPIRVIRKIADARIEMDVSMSIFPQVLAYYALSNSSYHEQLKQLNSELQEQANEFVTQLHQEIGQSFTCQEPRGGQYIWVEYLQGSIGPKEMNFLVEKKLLCAPSYIFGLRLPFLRFNFARLSLEEIPKVISILKEAADHWLEDEKKESIR